MSTHLICKIDSLLHLVNNYLGINTQKEQSLGDILCNDSESIAKRMRTCFELKAINNESAIDALYRGLIQSKSALLKHEIAYVLGQMRNKYAIKYLITVLEDLNEECIVRHECCEALGAIADISVIDTVRKFTNDKSFEVAQTAQLALESLLMAKNQNIIPISKYNSVDPAPPFDINKYKNNLNKLKEIYLNQSNSLFKRYRAMFTLRDIGNNDAINILCEGLKDENSALFRHEIAFVLGQLMNVDKNGIESLKNVLNNENESSMVRHEAAEALGSIAQKECMDVINQHLNDKQDVVKESCIVATDIYEFWNK
eukprot:133403_1